VAAGAVGVLVAAAVAAVAAVVQRKQITPIRQTTWRRIQHWPTSTAQPRQDVELAEAAVVRVEVGAMQLLRPRRRIRLPP